VIYNCDKKEVLPEPVAALLIDIYNDEIEVGNHDAMCDLGFLYYTGRIGEQNYEKAFYYYEMSAKLGNRQAQENLGYCWYYGRTGTVDYEKAYHYFIKGALDNHLISLY
jgi:TPR repeat protein